MSAVEALRLAQANGIRLGVAGADLILDAERKPERSVLEAIRRNKAEIVALLGADHDAWTVEDWKAFYDERAGIAEFDGGQSREQAQAMAFESCVVEWMNRHLCRTDPGRCAACGEPDREGRTVVPFGTESHGHAWLHPECWKEWHRERQAHARQALAATGLPVPQRHPEGFPHAG
jgi:hypothetical protein